MPNDFDNFDDQTSSSDRDRHSKSHQPAKSPFGCSYLGLGLIAAVLFLGCPFIFIMIGAITDLGEKARKVPGSGEPVVTADAATMLNELKGNPALASKKYDGKRIKVECIVMQISKEEAGYQVMVGTVAPFTIQFGVIGYSRSQENLVADLVPQGRYVIEGDCNIETSKQGNTIVVLRNPSPAVVNPPPLPSKSKAKNKGDKTKTTDPD